MTESITTDDFQKLAAFRYQLRRFLRLSEEAARAVGLEPQQHQLLLAVKGLPDDRQASVGEIAERLQLQHHSTVELINRLEERGLVERERSEADRRQVLVRLTPHGDDLLHELSVFHRSELRTIGPNLIEALASILSGSDSVDLWADSTFEVETAE